ncbi:AAA family ATPase [Bradyrhizobium liaoningense]|uniref:AAA family ATPase n=1 Tax=Bradyrhizobium liaoningense TaxID=43992 RepID=UPI001BA6F42E|nr:AAA family ATPase [Bradyrhizobium liaoningense]MBR0712701.1 AAA family ATPase [Bradyrhizobium liaoningense]
MTANNSNGPTTSVDRSDAVALARAVHAFGIMPVAVGEGAKGDFKRPFAGVDQWQLQTFEQRLAYIQSVVASGTLKGIGLQLGPISETVEARCVDNDIPAGPQRDAFNKGFTEYLEQHAPGAAAALRLRWGRGPSFIVLTDRDVIRFEKFGDVNDKAAIQLLGAGKFSAWWGLYRNEKPLDTDPANYSHPNGDLLDCPPPCVPAPILSAAIYAGLDAAGIARTASGGYDNKGRTFSADDLKYITPEYVAAAKAELVATRDSVHSKASGTGQSDVVGRVGFKYGDLVKLSDAAPTLMQCAYEWTNDEGNMKRVVIEPAPADHPMMPALRDFGKLAQQFFDELDGDRSQGRKRSFARAVGASDGLRQVAVADEARRVEEGRKHHAHMMQTLPAAMVQARASSNVKCGTIAPDNAKSPLALGVTQNRKGLFEDANGDLVPRVAFEFPDADTATTAGFKVLTAPEEIAKAEAAWLDGRAVVGFAGGAVYFFMPASKPYVIDTLNIAASANRKTRKPERMRKALKRPAAPMVELVKGMVPERSAMLIVADPKAGKSYLTQDLTISIADGAEYAGMQCQQRGVLYLAYEETHAQVMDRVRKLRPSGLSETAQDLLFQQYYDDGVPQLGADFKGGLLEHLDDVLEENPELHGGVVVMDTMNEALGDIEAGQRGKTDYKIEKKALQVLTAYAKSRGITIIILHHTNKDDSGSLTRKISGSQGILGGTDGYVILEIEPENPYQMKVRGTARGIGHIRMDWERDQNETAWTPVGTEGEGCKQTQIERVFGILVAMNCEMQAADIAAQTGLDASSVVTKYLNRLHDKKRIQGKHRGVYGIANAKTRLEGMMECIVASGILREATGALGERNDMFTGPVRMRLEATGSRAPTRFAFERDVIEAIGRKFANAADALKQFCEKGHAIKDGHGGVFFIGVAWVTPIASTGFEQPASFKAPAQSPTFTPPAVGTTTPAAEANVAAGRLPWDDGKLVPRPVALASWVVVQ